MLPPISPMVIEQNPKFKILYNDLNASRLTPDGSSKLLKRQRAQEELKRARSYKHFSISFPFLTIIQMLQTTRTELAKTEIIVNAIERLGSGGLDLPPELVHVVRVVCAQLDGSLTAEDREVLVEDFEYFVERIEDVAKVMSGYLIGHAYEIAAIMESADNPSLDQQAPTISTLPSKATMLRSTITNQSSALASKNMQVADMAVMSADITREILQSAVRIIEQSMHGTVSRATQARAEHLATVARGMELKIAIITHAANASSPDSTLTDLDTKRAIDAYAAHLRNSKKNLTAQERSATMKLNDYSKAGLGMQDIAKRFSELTVEMSEVEDEIAHLNGAG